MNHANLKGKTMVVTRLTSWGDVLNAARTTSGKSETSLMPTESWKKKILISEHSPIRALLFTWTWEVPYFVSVHLTRHKVGIEHFVKSQRPESTGIPREKLPQDAMVSHRCVANAQAIINMCRARLCHRAAKETRTAVDQLVIGIEHTEPELAVVCVPPCVYRGFCPEIRTCGFSTTPSFDKKRKIYKNLNKC
jgi:hypothetical protein